MKKQSPSTAWNPIPTQQLWALILVIELVVFVSTYALLGKVAFFWIGLFLTYNLGLYFFPYLYFFYYPLEQHKTRIYLQALETLKNAFPVAPTIHLYLEKGTTANFLCMHHKNNLWVVCNESLWEKLDPREQQLIAQQIYHLWQEGPLSSATLFTALQYTLPLRRFLNQKGRELMFTMSSPYPVEWQKLCYKLIHWTQEVPAKWQDFSGCFLFPVLTNYPHKSYFALYSHLRNTLITALKQEGDTYESAKSGGFIFNPHPFDRFHSSDGPGPSTPPTNG